MIVIDYKDRRPIYEQIIDRVKMLIVKGVYKPDDPLPSVRSLAMELSINPNTIQRAYQELERQGLIYSVKGRGSFVNGTDGVIKEHYEKMLNDLKEELFKIIEAGIEKSAVMALVESCFGEENSQKVSRLQAEEGDQI